MIFLSDCFYDFFSFAVSLVSSCIMITKYKVKAKAYPFWIRENLFFIGKGGGGGRGWKEVQWWEEDLQFCCKFLN